MNENAEHEKTPEGVITMEIELSREIIVLMKTKTIKITNAKNVLQSCIDNFDIYAEVNPNSLETPLDMCVGGERARELRKGCVQIRTRQDTLFMEIMNLIRTKDITIYTAKKALQLCLADFDKYFKVSAHFPQILV